MTMAAERPTPRLGPQQNLQEAIKQALSLEKTVEGADLVINRFKLQVI
jgi:hypothetical protein